MRLKALATTGLVLSIGFSSFSYGGIASAETTGQIVAQEQQYRYDKLRKALPTIGANWIKVQADALAPRTQGALVLKINLLYKKKLTKHYKQIRVHF
jgi:hypothetical protein